VILMVVCQPVRSGMRILVVEDDSKMAELLRRGLAKEGHLVTVAIDGISGLEEAQARTLDVIVLDIMLPSMDGLTRCTSPPLVWESNPYIDAHRTRCRRRYCSRPGCRRR
jgi:hypothetical protein